MLTDFSLGLTSNNNQTNETDRLVLNYCLLFLLKFIKISLGTKEDKLIYLWADKKYVIMMFNFLCYKKDKNTKQDCRKQWQIRHYIVQSRNKTKWIAIFSSHCKFQRLDYEDFRVLYKSRGSVKLFGFEIKFIHTLSVLLGIK